MDITAIIKAIVAPVDKQGADATANLKPGDKLWGRVVRLEADGRLLIDLGKFRAQALSTVPAKAGDVMRLQVVQTGTPLHLKVEPHGADSDVPFTRMPPVTVLSASEQQRLIDILDRLAPGGLEGSMHRPLPDHVGNALAQMRASFNPMPIQRSAGEIAVWLRQMLEDSGLFLEQKLAQVAISKGEAEAAADSLKQAVPHEPPPATAAISRDAKAQLLMIKDFLSQDFSPDRTMRQVNDKEMDFLRKSVERLLAHVENQQEHLVRKDAGPDTGPVVAHWLLHEDRNHTIQLKAYYPKEKNKDETGGMHRIALLLDMDRLGMLRVDLAMLGGQLHIDFFVPEETVKKEIEANLQVVDDRLKTFFEALVITVRVAEDKIARFNLEDNTGGTPGRIDIQV